jgi:hypothetical protein
MQSARLSLGFSLSLVACAGATADPAASPPSPPSDIPVVDIGARPPPAPEPPPAKEAAPTPPAETRPDAKPVSILGGLQPTPQGVLSGDEIGEAFGYGGVGLSGVGTGAGGIGLGRIGHGPGGGQVRTKTPTPKLGTAAVSGRLPAEVIRRIVRMRFHELRACYERGLKTQPKLRGKITVSFVIGPDGSVRSATNAGSDLPDPGVVACVTKTFHAMKFPQPEGGVVMVTYPVAFSPGDDAADGKKAAPTTKP